MSYSYSYEHGVTGSSSGLYRSRNGWLFGVCGGIAEHWDLQAGWIRLLVCIAFLVTGFWPAGAAYVAAALIMKPAPRYRDY